VVEGYRLFNIFDDFITEEIAEGRHARSRAIRGRFEEFWWPNDMARLSFWASMKINMSINSRHSTSTRSARRQEGRRLRVVAQ
jgi:hypothetical protein